jgi:hypothetical protein
MCKKFKEKYKHLSTLYTTVSFGMFNMPRHPAFVNQLEMTLSNKTVSTDINDNTSNNTNNNTNNNNNINGITALPYIVVYKNSEVHDCFVVTKNVSDHFKYYIEGIL